MTDQQNLNRLALNMLSRDHWNWGDKWHHLHGLFLAATVLMLNTDTIDKCREAAISLQLQEKCGRLK